MIREAGMRGFSLTPEFKRHAAIAVMLIIIAAGATSLVFKKSMDDVPEYSGSAHMDLVKAYMQSEYTAVFSPYYDMTYVKELADYKERFNEKNGAITAEFVMKAAYKNYYKDPDTVPYIIETKNEGNAAEYKKLYDEYNSEREASFTLKFEGKIKNGKAECKKLYSAGANDSWYRLKDGLAEYIISEE